MGCESLKVGIIVGLEREKRLVPKKSNIFVEKGYGQKAYFVAKKLISKKIDVLISFGLAKSISKKIENTQILIPKMTFDEEGKGLYTSKKYSSYFKKRIPFKIWDKNIITVSKVLNNKKNLKGKDIGGIDMESHLIHRVAKENKIKFTCIRIIFDDEQNPIPNFLIESLDENGDPRFIKLTRKTLEKPIRIKQLFELGFQYYKSKKILKRVAKKAFSNC
tara:strand:- start:3088 stop:3744 length:657 start_codon:yes stop_codon:yes gene_type:complete